MSAEIEKLKYQINLLISLVDSDKHPVESMILSLGWNDKDLNDAHDIFERYDNFIESKETEINWIAFEHELRDKFDISYQTVKVIVNAFYKNYQWVDVCYHYAKKHTCVEFHQLIRDYDQKLFNK